MPMDGLTIGAVVHELNNTLLDAKIDRVNQPEVDELVLLCRKNGENYKLLLCSSPSFARLNITSISKQNPSVPPSFCMLLRKHLTGAKIAAIKQIDNERIVKITFSCLNDFNEPVDKHIIIEIMGKHSNIIFIDDNKRIFDSIKHVNSLMSRVRLIQPGITYELPPSQNRFNPFTFNAFENKLEANSRRISETFTGFSSQAAQELAFFLERFSSADGFEKFLSPYKKKTFSPVLLVDENKNIIDFFAVKQARFLDAFQVEYPSISAAIDAFFVSRDEAQRIKERSHDLQNKLSNLLEKAKRNAALFQEKLAECSDAEKYRIFGELITANLFLIKRGAKIIKVKNYYDNMNELEIPLDSTVSPSANAQKYFKRYNKLKTASKLLECQIEQNNTELDYFTEQLENLEKCETESDINDIKNELSVLGYIKAQKSKTKCEKSKPMHFISTSGIDIYVGKNNTQNDYLTLHFAQSDDLWLHTKSVHGSHVIVRATSPDTKTIEEAAMLAAFYSKARLSDRVAVDATKRRYIKKPSGAASGKVIYTNQTTYYVLPDEKTIRQLKRVDR